MTGTEIGRRVLPARTWQGPSALAPGSSTPDISIAHCISKAARFARTSSMRSVTFLICSVTWYPHSPYQHREIRR
eukprot:3774966-Rhodomonas_salina.1